MREFLYTVLELEEWCSKNANCDFCSWLENKGDRKVVCQIRTRTKINGDLVENDKACESCKEKFENDELPKCERCGRLRIKDDICNGKYVCRCIEKGEDLEEKELPDVPYESQAAFYERQINSLQEQLTTAEIENDTHLEALEIAEDWHKRQKQELIEKMEKLEKENKQVKATGSSEIISELISRIEKLETEVEKLKEQQNNQVAQIETPAKEKSIKGLFKLGGKK